MQPIQMDSSQKKIIYSISMEVTLLYSLIIVKVIELEKVTNSDMQSVKTVC